MEAVFAVIFNTIAANESTDAREEQLEALRNDGLHVNDMKPSEFATTPEAQTHATKLIVALADVILIAAPGERDQWSQRLGRTLQRFAILPVVPAPSPKITSSTVTIYAPSWHRVQTTIYQRYLHMRRVEGTVISADNALDSISTRVVVAPEWNPMRARALAASGHTVVTPAVGGVEAMDSRIHGYTPFDHADFAGALDSALLATTKGVALEVSSSQSASQVATCVQVQNHGPRASVIVRTYNRPALLARAIASLAAQSHRNLEIVVVNNGGDDVRDIIEAAAAGRPFHYERMSERRLIGAASNVGARAATGTYIGYLDDDDLLYADHCATGVTALERTNADIVFTQCLGEFSRIEAKQKHVLGYRIYLERSFALDDVYVANMAPIHSIMHPRSLFERFGYFEEALPVTDDWELWLRVVSGGGRVHHVDRVTCEYSWRYDPQHSNMSIDHQWDFVATYKAITAKYAHDVLDRPRLHQRQENTLNSQLQRALDAENPELRADDVVIQAMSEGMVSAGPIVEPW